MKIIQDGSEELLMKYIRFICQDCSCIFDATKYEYEYCGSQREGDCWKSKCPRCETVVYSKKKVGW